MPVEGFNVLPFLFDALLRLPVLAIYVLGMIICLRNDMRFRWQASRIAGAGFAILLIGSLLDLMLSLLFYAMLPNLNATVIGTISAVRALLGLLSACLGLGLIVFAIRTVGR